MSFPTAALATIALAPTLLAAQRIDRATLDWMQGTLARWESVCRDDLRITPARLPWIIFFDDTHAWHIAPERPLLPPHHQTTKHSLRFAGARYRIFEVANQSGLWVPDRPPLDVKAQSVAMPYAGDSKALFVLAVPALQAQAAGAPLTKDLEDFFAGAALHELTHTRQLPHLMPVLQQLQSRRKFPESIDDNLVQNTFAANGEFLRMRSETGKHLTAAVLAASDGVARVETRLALEAARDLRKRFFIDNYRGWDELEDAFLALEGAAMWVQFQHSRRAAPGEDWRQTLGVLMQRANSWSQSDGLALFLLIDRFDPKWPTRFFANSAPPSPIEVLEELVGQTSKP